MPLVVVFLRHGGIERIRFVDAIPDRTCPFDPVVIGQVGMNRDGVLARFSKHENVVRERRPQPR